jgi:hypothetical protein
MWQRCLRWSTFVRFLVLAACVIALVFNQSSGVTMQRPTYGVYAGAGSKGVAGAVDFGVWSGRYPQQVVDFPPTATWSDISGPLWLFSPYGQAGTRLVFSLPLLPDDPGTTLAACAAGAYDSHWSALGRNLVSYQLEDTIVRPGWEFNGSWYRWSAAGKVSQYVGCYRRVVQSLRSVVGQDFSFDWNPNLGRGTFPAEQAYPGDAYVDYVGVDVYDVSWIHYPVARTITVVEAQQRAWKDILNGKHGLRFWANFASSHGKRLSIPEWGVTYRSDGHGGGDNPRFIANMIHFIEDPKNRVAYANYFNSPDSADLAHDIRRPDSRFPASAAEYLRRMRALSLAWVW